MNLNATVEMMRRVIFAISFCSSAVHSSLGRFYGSLLPLPLTHHRPSHRRPLVCPVAMHPKCTRSGIRATIHNCELINNHLDTFSMKFNRPYAMSMSISRNRLVLGIAFYYFSVASCISIYFSVGRAFFFFLPR